MKTNLELHGPQVRLRSSRAVSKRSIDIDKNTSVLILAENEYRKYYLVYNDSGKDVFIAFADYCSINSFSFILANGSIYTPTTSMLYLDPMSAIITGSGSANIVTTEFY